MQDLYEFFFEFMGAVRRHAVPDGARPFCRWCCSRATCLSAGLFGRGTLPIPATLVLSHTQFLLPARLVCHQFESQLLPSRCDLSLVVQTQSLALQVEHHQFKFSPVTSVQVHIQVGALSIVLSESRYMTSVQRSKSVVVRLSDSDQLPT